MWLGLGFMLIFIIIIFFALLVWSITPEELRHDSEYKDASLKERRLMRRGFRESRENSTLIGEEWVPWGEEIGTLQYHLDYMWEQDEDYCFMGRFEHVQLGYVDAAIERLKDSRAELNNKQAQLKSLINQIEEEAYRDYELVHDSEALTDRYSYDGLDPVSRHADDGICELLEDIASLTSQISVAEECLEEAEFIINNPRKALQKWRDDNPD